MDAEFAHLT